MSEPLLDARKWFPEHPDPFPRPLLKRLCFGKTSIPDWEPIRKTKNSTVRFATIVGDFLQESLQFEGEEFLLTQHSWRNILEFARVDFILVESVWEDCTGDWNLAQHPSSERYAALLSILEEAKKRGIPTVYWQTAGQDDHELYAACAQNFDAVFCADQAEIAMFAAEGVSAAYLPPCVQPALANPFKHYAHYDTLRWDIVYDGWKDLERKPALWDILAQLAHMDLHLIESNALLFQTAIFSNSEQLPAYAPYLHGCVTPAQRRTLFKYAKIHVTLPEGISSACRQRWLMLEAAACGCLPLYHGTLPEEDVCRGVARECDTTDRLLLEAECCRQDPWYQKRLAHLAWRKVNMEHTFAHRMRSICQRIGVHHDWVEYPLVSMVTPTYRKENLESVIQTCAGQSYPHKEHIVVTNGFRVPREEQRTSADCPVTYAAVPEEHFAGACLNLGFQQAQGKYVYRIDDDDLYGPHYILDTILHNRALDIDFWGKMFQYLKDERPVIKERIREGGIFHNCIYNPQCGDNVWPAGCSFAGKKSFFETYRFLNNLFGAADAAFQFHLKSIGPCVLFDEFNLVVFCSEDVSKHTWKIKSSSISTIGDPLLFNEPIV